MEPQAVLIDFHRHTYLQIGQQGNTLRVIPMEPTSAGLTVRRLTPAKQRELGIKVLDYPVKKAERIFKRQARLHGTRNKQVAEALHIRRRK